MNELYVSDYIKSITVERTDNDVTVISDPYVLNQLGCLLVPMSQEDELELKKFLEEEGKAENTEVNNDEVDLEGSFLFCHNRNVNDDIVLNKRVNNGSNNN